MMEFLYKYGLVIFLMLTISVLAIQKEANEIIPNQTIVTTLRVPGGFIPIILRKGVFNKDNEGKTWVTEKEFEKRKRTTNRRRPKVDNRHTFEANEKGEK